MFKALLLNLALLLILGIGSSAAGNSDLAITASVIMSKEALIVGREIFLGDIASIASSDKTLEDRLRGINVCSAADPGLSQTLHLGYVKSRVRQQGISPESINWTGSEQIAVKTRSQHLSAQEIISYAEKFITEQIETHEKGGDKGEEQGENNQAIQKSEIQIVPVNEIRPLTLPYGELAVKVESMPGSSRNGIMPLRFIISVDDCVCERRVIFFKLTIIKEILVAANDLDRHAIIAEEDLRLALRDIGGSLAHDSVFSQKADLIGKRTKRMIREGIIIAQDMVEDMPVVNQGDLVTIIIESPTFIITTQGKAREAGVRHQMIRIMNTSSRREITAEVLDENLVRVAFSGQR